MTRLTRLYPKEFRDRYAAEIEDLLMRSPHPFRDRLNLAAHGIVTRMEYIMNRTSSPLMLVAAGLAASSITALLLAIPDLAGGLRDVPRHWWSALPLVGLGAAAVLSLWSWRQGSRRS